MEKLLIGEIIKPQGIKGEVKINLHNKSMMLNSCESLIIDNNVMNVETYRLNSGFMYVLFKDVNDIQTAEGLRGLNVYLSAVQANELKTENQFFVEEIMGFTVITTNGESVGNLEDLQNFGSKDIMYISLNGKSVLVPVVDELIEYINRETKTIILNNKLFSEVACYED